MKVKQNPMFQPITITLETPEEAEALWDALRSAETLAQDAATHRIIMDLSNWFSNHAQLGGK